ncbi:uncharacterized protein LOC111797624 [Cucurbita pepo subsp. pepo]|uniref:uncharacterized protein LOC111797624 n=1 Tax=Cucurbita pepo subsp. pepo TaxID=3664 RepID=UPI000C9DA214|nr:uncharacterized protein LOC111797624 [Cucurbita pepo subsp. pepo]
MESDDDFQLLSSPAVDSPLVSGRKLKRLKKASVLSEELPRVDDQFSSGVLGEFSRIDDRFDDSLKMRELSAAETDADDSDKFNGQDLDDSDELRQSGSGSRDLDDGGNLEPSLGLDDQENDSGAEKGLEFDAVAGIDEIDEYQSPRIGEESGDSLVDELVKKRPSLDSFEDEREAKRRKSKNKRLKSSGEPEDFNETAVSKRTLEKERREYVEQLRAESQRLLRDTRGAAFKPMPLVRKPISSVLEKIRQRKLELSRKSINIENAILDCDDDDNYLCTEVVIKHRLSVEGRADSVERECEDMDQHPADLGNRKGSMCIDERSNGTNMPFEREKATDDVTEAFWTPINDTQELFSDSQTSNGDDVSNEMSKNPLQENFTPSVLAMNLKHESAPLDDELNETSRSHLQENFTPSVLAMNLRLDSAALDEDSDEEDNDKENVNPHPHGLSNLPSLASGDPVKAFVDDEAEEEDDSDHDMRFQDEDEDEYTDSEELQDMIATAYEENPLDNEKRNELHQKWLEQEDAAGTEDLLQKLKYGSKFTTPALLDDVNNEGENDDFEFCEAAAEDLLPLNVARMNIRKVKQMLPQMYTDNDDQYMSDDEETERRIERERVLYKAEEKSTFLSPAEDESTREVFGLIKKLNVVSDVKKRPKAQSFLDPPLTGVGKNITSKSSFLGRSSNLSLSSSRKHVSSINSRSFIFGRDDSNSKSAIPTMEETSDQGQNENKPTRISSAKFSYSQVRPSAQNEAKPGSSLFDILRQSSLQLQRKPCTFGEESSQMSSAFASFKLEKTHMKKPIKTEGRFLI